jgi:hypothetical protein
MNEYVESGIGSTDRKVTKFKRSKDGGGDEGVKRVGEENKSITELVKMQSIFGTCREM